MNTLHQQLEDFRRMPDGKIIQGASHTSRVLNHKIRNKIIIKAVCDLRKIADTFDSIVCCGISGLLVGPQVAELLNKHIVVVRKQEKAYSDFLIEGVVPFRYIIIDDLICSGDTIKYIQNTIYEDCPRSSCIGAYFYMPEECVYTKETSKLFKKKYKTVLLNPCQITT